jgi:hypothetical protein
MDIHFSIRMWVPFLLIVPPNITASRSMPFFSRTPLIKEFIGCSKAFPFSVLQPVPFLSEVQHLGGEFAPPKDPTVLI